ncbi:MAG: hypothetical protein HY904_05165 [Deltaproteobacteria bacterium]|nr:hypothetical protein [Deltaproteobacteria bacterium]
MMTSDPTGVIFADEGRPGSAVAGQKGAWLARMAALGLPVPAAAIVPVAACRGIAGGEAVADALLDALAAGLHARTGEALDDGNAPLWLAVRSSPVLSMPGVLDTALTVGLTSRTLPALARRLGEHAAHRVLWRHVASWARRGRQLDGTRVSGDPFVARLEAALAQHGVDDEADLPLDALAELRAHALEHLARQGRAAPPDDAREQLRAALHRVCRGWHDAQATTWRLERGLPPEPAMAVVVQRMVFGMGPHAGVGTALSRHPNRGDQGAHGEYVAGALGDELTDGLRSGAPLVGTSGRGRTLEEDCPAALAALREGLPRLERDARTPVEVEFAVENGALAWLQARPAGLAAHAALRAVQDMRAAGHLTDDEALALVPAEGLVGAGAMEVVPDAERRVLARGVPAQIGAATGVAVLDPGRVAELARAGVPVVLIRPEARAEDVPAMRLAAALVTARGGTTCHAAVVARVTGVPCVVSCQELRVDPLARQATSARGAPAITEGMALTVDGAAGEVLLGAAPLRHRAPPPGLDALLALADARRKLPVWTRADTPADVGVALAQGAAGIARCSQDALIAAPELRALASSGDLDALAGPLAAHARAVLAAAGRAPVILWLAAPACLGWGADDARLPRLHAVQVRAWAGAAEGRAVQVAAPGGGAPPAPEVVARRWSINGPGGPGGMLVAATDAQPGDAPIGARVEGRPDPVVISRALAARLEFIWGPLPSLPALRLAVAQAERLRRMGDRHDG